MEILNPISFACSEQLVSLEVAQISPDNADLQGSVGLNRLFHS